MSEATLRLISGPAEDEQTVSIRELAEALRKLDDGLSVISLFCEQVKARGHDAEVFDEFVALFESAEFSVELNYWLDMSLNNGDASAADTEAEWQEQELDGDEPDDETEDEATND